MFHGNECSKYNPLLTKYHHIKYNNSCTWNEKKINVKHMGNSIMKIKFPTSQHHERKTQPIKGNIKCEIISSKNVENTK